MVLPSSLAQWESLGTVLDVCLGQNYFLYLSTSIVLFFVSQAKRLPYSVAPSRRGNFSQGSWMGEMQQASDKSVIISEILDPRTKNLLSMSKISDYVLSNELVSMALAMVAEDRQINDVLEELFAEEVQFESNKNEFL